MDAIVERCAGLDVHQASVVACVLLGEPGRKPRKEVRSFGTMTRDQTWPAKPPQRMGPSPRSFAADAHGCIMVRPRAGRPHTSLRRDDQRPARRAPLRSSRIPPRRGHAGPSTKAEWQ